MYADDTQIYITLKPNGKDDATRKLSSCLEDIRFWSSNNRLCLNERKSEMIHITSKIRNTDSFPDLITRNGSLKGRECVRDLGVLIDKNLTFQQHIKNVCKSATFGIFKIGKIRKLLDQPTEKLTHAFVSSHLDYCNSNLFRPSAFVPTSTSKNSEYCWKACYSLEKIWAHNPNIAFSSLASHTPSYNI